MRDTVSPGRSNLRAYREQRGFSQEEFAHHLGVHRTYLGGLERGERNLTLRLLERVVGWTANTADTGVIVNGNDVTAYGLFAEHFQKYEVIWNGERGRTIMFQNEMPYDVPDQASWTHDGVNGYAAYKVGASVEAHEAWGIGSYSFFNAGPDIHASHAFEVPDTSGVKLHDVLTVFLSGNGGIDHVVNNTGAAVSSANQVTNVVSYP